MSRVHASFKEQISMTRFKALQAALSVYVADLPDPGAIEVLLVVDAVLAICGVSTPARRMLFGARAQAILDEWDIYAGPTPGPEPVGLSAWTGRKSAPVTFRKEFDCVTHSQTVSKPDPRGGSHGR